MPNETPLRKRIGEFMMDGTIPEWAAEQLDQLAREQEAASSRAKRPKTLDELKQRIWSDTEEIAYQAALEDATRVCCEGCEGPKRIRALASPHAQGEIAQRWRRHHPQLPIVARDE